VRTENNRRKTGENRKQPGKKWRKQKITRKKRKEKKNNQNKTGEN